ncbi:hypothetical protein CAPTEDRAFT_22791, partial [Capitella teleta]
QKRARWKKGMALSWREFRMNTTLWRSAFKRIEGHFGAGVVMYFKFLKWMFQLNILLFLLVLLFLVLPEALLTDNMNVSSSAVELVVDFLQGTGWMEKTVMFYGDYSDQTLAAFANWNYNMPLANIVIIAAIFLVSLLVMVHNTARGFREQMFAQDDASRNYGNKVFSAWDFSMEDPKNSLLRQKSNHWSFISLLEQERYLEKIKGRTTKEKCKLWSVRILINFIVLCFLGGGAYLIYFATTKTTESSDFSTYSFFLQLLIGYAVSLTITVLNSTLPALFKFLVKFEDYSAAWMLNMTLIRTVFLRLASLTMLVITLYTEITCVPQDSCGCWETKVGQELYKLVITDFLVVVGVTFLVEFPRKFLVTKCKIFKMVGQQQFDITKNVLDLIYGESLLWLGTFFCPMIPIITVIKNFFVFYIKQATVLVNYAPSQVAVVASDAESFFLIVLLATFCVTAIPILYIVFRMSPSKSCGPYRIYDTVYDILPIAMEGFPPVIKEICDWLFSAMILIPLFIVLCLLIYYKGQMATSYKEMIGKLREQLLMEGHDKHFLMKQV